MYISLLLAHKLSQRLFTTIYHNTLRQQTQSIFRTARVLQIILQSMRKAQSPCPLHEHPVAPASTFRSETFSTHHPSGKKSVQILDCIYFILQVSCFHSALRLLTMRFGAGGLCGENSEVVAVQWHPNADSAAPTLRWCSGPRCPM